MLRKVTSAFLSQKQKCYFPSLWAQAALLKSMPLVSKGLEQFSNALFQRISSCQEHHKSLTYLTSQPYTSDKMQSQEEREDDITKFSSEAAKISEKILRGELSDLKKEEFTKKGSLGEKLFKTGILRSELSPNNLQERFKAGPKEEEKIIFIPTGLTTALFKIILEEEKKSYFYLTSHKGVGKSFSTALLVLLLRKDPRKRVCYIHSAEDFLLNPTDYLIKEFKRAFAEELQENNRELDKKLESLIDLTNDLRIVGFESLLSKIDRILREKKIEPFFIIDQVNTLEKCKDDNDRNKFAFSLYQLLKGSNLTNVTTALICSATNEAATIHPTQQYPLKHLPFTLPTNDQSIEFILTESGGFITEKDVDQIAQILQFTGKHFLMMREILSRYEKTNDKASLDQVLSDYKEEKLLEITTDLRKFFEPDKNKRDDLIRRRKEAMTTVLYTLLGRPEGDLNPPKLPKRFEGQLIDQRYFVYNGGKGTIDAVNPLVTIALRQILDDVSQLRTVIAFFDRKQSGLGRIFQDVVLKFLPNSQNHQELSLQSFKPGEEINRKIMFTSFTRKECDNREAFDFSGAYRLNVPMNESFAALDGFLITPSEVFAVQTKKRFEKSDLKELIAYFNKTQQEKNPVGSEPPSSKEFNKNSIPYALEKTVQSAQKANKTLSILLVSISQDPETDPAFSELRNCKDLTVKFYYFDAVQAFVNLGLEDQILKVEPSASLRSQDNQISSKPTTLKKKHSTHRR